MLKTVIIDAEKQEREKITSLLSAEDDFEVLAQGKDGYDALKLISCLKPDIAILDINLEYIEGEELPPLLKARSPLTAVVILTSGIDDHQIYRAASNRVSGFIHKNTDMEKLPGILKCIAEGGCFISSFFAPRILYLLSELNRRGIGISNPSLMTPAEKPPGRQNGTVKLPSRPCRGPDPPIPSGKDPTGYLSKMELRVLTNLGEGYNSDDIAKNLGLAVGTVRNYISTVMHKTGLQNRSQLVRYAYNYGIVPLHQ